MFKRIINVLFNLNTVKVLGWSEGKFKSAKFEVMRSRLICLHSVMDND